MSLVGRLLLLLCLGLLPAAAVLLSSELGFREARQIAAREEALRLAALVNADQGSIADGARQVLAMLASLNSARGEDAARCSDSFAQKLAAVPRYAELLLLDLDGRVRCAGRPENLRREMGQAGFFRAALAAGDFVIGGYGLAPPHDQPTLFYARPLTGSDGQVQGVVAAALDLEWLGARLAALPLPQDSLTVVADQEGRILARQPHGGLRGETMLPAVRQLVQAAQPGVSEVVSRDGVTRIIGYVPATQEPRGLYVGVGLNEALVLTAMDQANRRSAALVLVGALSALLLAWFTARWFIQRPVLALLRASARWRDGGGAVRAGQDPALRRDRSEFGQLAQAFDAMAAAAEARQRALAAALESTADCVVVLDAGWRFSFLNGRARDRLGDGLEGRTIWECFPELLGTPVSAALQRSMQDRVATETEAHVATLNAWLEAETYPADDGGITLFFRDVTAERLAAAAAAEGETRLRATYAAAPIGLCLIDPALRLVEVNEHLAELSGRQSSVLAGQTLAEAMPGIGAMMEATARQVLERNEPADNCEYESRGPREERRIWLASFHPVRSGPEEVTGISAAIMDITNRRAVEDALMRSEERMRMAQEASAVGTWDWDLETGGIIWSRQQYALFGILPGAMPQMDGYKFLEFVHPEDRATVQEAGRRALKTGRYEAEFRIIRYRADGSEETRWLIGRGQRVLADRGPGRIVGVNVDLTERKQTEQHLALLMREVDHRAKNALAVVQAMLRLTRAKDLPSFIEAVEGRVSALARTQTLLSASRWAGAELRNLLEGELGAFLSSGHDAPVAELAGPDVSLEPNLAQPISMALHELATNAVKYGGLSRAGGGVRVEWELANLSTLLLLRWSEHGGPPLPGPPQRRGFGTRVLEATVQEQLGGRLQRHWHDQGLVVELQVPLRRRGLATEPMPVLATA